MAIQAQLYSDNIGLNQYSFGHQWKAQVPQINQEHQHLQDLQNQSLCFENNRESIMYFSQAVKQRDEIDEFIRSQNERLGMLLQEQRKQQVAVLIKRIESKASILLQQKDEEIVKARNRTMELTNMLKKLEMENQVWQRVAQESEAMVVSLNNTIEQLQTSYCINNNNNNNNNNNGVDDEESCCEVNREEEMKTEENRGLTIMVCKNCKSRSSCVLFLPCRHLCSCKDCAAFLDCCPVCRTAKKASIEALIS